MIGHTTLARRARGWTAGAVGALLTLGSMTALSPAASAEPGSLLASYDFSEASGSVLNDTSGAGRDGTVVGGAAWRGGFMDFTGSNYVKLPDGLLAGRSAATIVIETSPKALSGAKFLWNFGGSGEGGTGQFFIQPVAPRLSISKTNWAGEQTATSQTKLVEDRWQSVAATIAKNSDGKTSTLRLYIDGVPVGEKVDSTTGLADLATHTMNDIGKSAYSADSLYQGLVSSFRVYSEALAPTDIAAVADADAQAAASESVAGIDLAAANAQDLAKVETRLTLPTAGSVVWTSSPAGIVAADGAVTQPVEDTAVTLTATSTVRGKTAARDFRITVLRAPTTVEAAQRDVDAVVLADADDVRSDLALPATGSRFGSALTWTSSAPAVIDTTGTATVAPGVVHRPADVDTRVVLTVTATKGGATASRAIPLTVRKAYAAPETTDYLFAHFTGTEGSPMDEQIYFATSHDAKTFTDTRANGNPVLKLDKGTGDGGVRDPYVLRSPEGDKFFLIATDLSIYHRGGWGSANATVTGSKNLVIWESTDLVNWSSPRLVDVAGAIPNAGMAWAPEAIWDDVTRQYYVYWATRADGNTELGDSVDVYLSTTRDFRTFSTPVKWIDRQGSIIDTTVIKVGDWYYRASGDGQITIERSKKLDAVTVSATAKTTGTDQEWVLVGTLQSILNGTGTCAAGTLYTGACLEGPEFFAYNEDDRGAAQQLFGLFADQYAAGKGYLPFQTTDISSTSASVWSKVSGVNMGALKKRHGGIMPITAQEYQRVMSAIGGVGANQDPKAESSATTRCVAGKATVIASTTNTDSRAADITLTTAFGAKTFTGVQPGKTVSQTFATRLGAVGDGYTSTVSTISGFSSSVSAGYAAVRCG